MGLKLNKISDEIIRENLERELQWVEQKLAAPPPPEDDPVQVEKFYQMLGKLSCDVGRMLYQQERPPEEIRTHLKRAGAAFLRAIEVRPMPKGNDYRSPWEFEKAVNLIVCFCDRELRVKASQISSWQYRYPPHPEHDAFARYLEALKKYLGGNELDDEELAQVITHCLSDAASKEDRQFLLPKSEGLKAVARQQPINSERAISELVKAHETEAQRGEYKRSRDGLMSLPALMLAKLCQERGMACNVSSPYLPLQLLDS
jgi:hypothetical protein